MILPRPALPPVAKRTGPVAWGSTRASFVSTAPFVDFGNGAMWKDAFGHKLTIYDAALKKAVGYVGQPGTGETYGANMIANGDMEAGIVGSYWAYNTTLTNDTERTGGSGVQSVKVTDNGAGQGYCYQPNLSFTFGTLYTFSAWVMNSAGVAPAWGIYNNSWVSRWIQYYTSTAWARITGKYCSAATESGFIFNTLWGYASKSCWMDDVELKAVLSPAVTGVWINTLPGPGGAAGWASIDSGFNTNQTGGYTYSLEA